MYNSAINQTQEDIASNMVTIANTEERMVTLSELVQNTTKDINSQRDDISSNSERVEENQNAILALKDITGNQLLESVENSGKQSRSVGLQENFTLADIHVSSNVDD